MNAIERLRQALQDACWAECRAVGVAEHEAAGRERDAIFAALAAVDALYQAAKGWADAESSDEYAERLRELRKAVRRVDGEA